MPTPALTASEPLGWLFIGLAVLFGLVLAGVVIYILREDDHGAADEGTQSLQDVDTDDLDDSDEEPPTEPAPLTSPTPLRKRIDEDGVDPNTYLARFVEEPDGEEVGETVGATADELVVKDGDDFYALPLEKVTEEEERLVADEDIDWEAANEAGVAWADGQEDRVEYDDDGMPVLDD